MFFSKKINLALGLACLLLSFSKNETAAPPKQNLSEYGFFKGDLKNLQATENVFAYEVNAALFSDYAEKARFIALPPGAKMRYAGEGSFEMPVGTVLIKNFYYSHEQAQPEKGRKILETRLLLREEKGWKALAYVWNEAQTDAVLEVAGASFQHSWRDAKGKKRSLEYIVPNLNQCKGCHSLDGQFVPIGTSAQQLNRMGESAENQLLAWQKQGLLELPADFKIESAPRLADYREPALDLDARARAYLDANCGHCHNARGPASTSGMFLDAAERDPERLGIGKPPVAAGRGSGKRDFGIVPGRPEKSILTYRMESDDPGIRMPELGRQLADAEGVELVKAWIKSLKN